MLSQDALEAILGIEEKVIVTPEEMAKKLSVTFFPYDKNTVSKNILSFAKELEDMLIELDVNIIPYNDSLQRVPMKKIVKRFFAITINNLIYFPEKIIKKNSGRIYIEWSVMSNLLKRKRIRAGISVIAVGEGTKGNLPMDYTSSFRRSLVATILDKPKNISTNSGFHEHFDTAMELFAKNMTNVVMAVDDNSWILYNFNASHPTYTRGENFKENILDAFISKVAAPMQPQKLTDFKVEKKEFDVKDEYYKPYIDDLVQSGKVLEKIGLYPPGKEIGALPFMNNYYRWIGKIHLDDRSGMSYGFLAWQLPSKLSKLIPLSELPEKYKVKNRDTDYFFDENNDLFIIVHLPSKGDFYLQVPDVTVLTQRSGCDKTNFIAQKDLLKMGILNGKMYLKTPVGATVSPDYKPSFDTKVILAHAVGNAIVASIDAYLNPNSIFSNQVENNGVALSHWHGYIDPKHIPSGWYVHGYNNPHVACSTPHSAIYAIDGKLNSYIQSLNDGEVNFLGDIHIEPHHGTNVNFTSLKDLANFLENNLDNVALGNEHLVKY